MPFISKTPNPPYYAVVFTSINADVDHAEHKALFKRMLERAEGYQGFLGIEAARNPDGCGVAVVYHDSIWLLRETPSIELQKGKAGTFGTATILSASVKLNATTVGLRNDGRDGRLRSDSGF